MNDYSRKQGVDMVMPMYGNALIHRSRNNALANIRPDADWVLFVDDDMVPEREALMRLLAHQQPVVSAFCTTRTAPARPAAKVYYEREDRFIPIREKPPENALINGQLAPGAAFLLMNRETVEALKEYYLSANDWLEESRPTLDRMHVRSEQRETERARKEEARRGFYQREKVLRIFYYGMGDNEIELGEDICLARNLMRLKIPVALDTSTVVGHIGEHPYGPWDIDWDSFKIEGV